MSDFDNVPENEAFDEFTQMQLSEFASSLAHATAAKIAVCLIDTGRALQVAIRTQSDASKSEQQMDAIHAMCAVAGGALSSATGGHLRLVVMDRKGDSVPVDDGLQTYLMETTHHG
jgi:hypothetical protein